MPGELTQYYDYVFKKQPEQSDSFWRDAATLLVKRVLKDSKRKNGTYNYESGNNQYQFKNEQELIEGILGKTFPLQSCNIQYRSNRAVYQTGLMFAIFMERYEFSKEEQVKLATFLMLYHPETLYFAHYKVTEKVAVVSALEVCGWDTEFPRLTTAAAYVALMSNIKTLIQMANEYLQTPKAGNSQQHEPQAFLRTIFRQKLNEENLARLKDVLFEHSANKPLWEEAWTAAEHDIRGLELIESAVIGKSNLTGAELTKAIEAFHAYLDHYEKNTKTEGGKQFLKNFTELLGMDVLLDEMKNMLNKREKSYPAPTSIILMWVKLCNESADKTALRAKFDQIKPKIQQLNDINGNAISATSNNPTIRAIEELKTPLQLSQMFLDETFKVDNRVGGAFEKFNAGFVTFLESCQKLHDCHYEYMSAGERKVINFNLPREKIKDYKAQVAQELSKGNIEFGTLGIMIDGDKYVDIISLIIHDKLSAKNDLNIDHTHRDSMLAFLILVDPEMLFNIRDRKRGAHDYARPDYPTKTLEQVYNMYPSEFWMRAFWYIMRSEKKSAQQWLMRWLGMNFDRAVEFAKWITDNKLNGYEQVIEALKELNKPYWESLFSPDNSRDLLESGVENVERVITEEQRQAIVNEMDHILNPDVNDDAYHEKMLNKIADFVIENLKDYDITPQNSQSVVVNKEILSSKLREKTLDIPKSYHANMCLKKNGQRMNIAEAVLMDTALEPQDKAAMLVFIAMNAPSTFLFFLNYQHDTTYTHVFEHAVKYDIFKGFPDEFEMTLLFGTLGSFSDTRCNLEANRKKIWERGVTFWLFMNSSVTNVYRQKFLEWFAVKAQYLPDRHIDMFMHVYLILLAKGADSPWNEAFQLMLSNEQLLNKYARHIATSGFYKSHLFLSLGSYLLAYDVNEEASAQAKHAFRILRWKAIQYACDHDNNGDAAKERDRSITVLMNKKHSDREFATLLKAGVDAEPVAAIVAKVFIETNKIPGHRISTISKYFEADLLVNAFMNQSCNEAQIIRKVEALQQLQASLETILSVCGTSKSGWDLNTPVMLSLISSVEKSWDSLSNDAKLNFLKCVKSGEISQLSFYKKIVSAADIKSYMTGLANDPDKWLDLLILHPVLMKHVLKGDVMAFEIAPVASKFESLVMHEECPWEYVVKTYPKWSDEIKKKLFESTHHSKQQFESKCLNDNFFNSLSSDAKNGFITLCKDHDLLKTICKLKHVTTILIHGMKNECFEVQFVKDNINIDKEKGRVHTYCDSILIVPVPSITPDEVAPQTDVPVPAPKPVEQSFVEPKNQVVKSDYTKRKRHTRLDRIKQSQSTEPKPMDPIGNQLEKIHVDPVQKNIDVISQRIISSHDDNGNYSLFPKQPNIRKPK